jgi:HK97 family phage prohead protease
MTRRLDLWALCAGEGVQYLPAPEPPPPSCWSLWSAQTGGGPARRVSHKTKDLTPELKYRQIAARLAWECLLTPKESALFDRRCGVKTKDVAGSLGSSVASLQEILQPLREEDRSFAAVVSSQNPDRVGDSVAYDGLQTANWRKVGCPVLFGHDQNKLPCGSCLRQGKMYLRSQPALGRVVARVFCNATTLGKDVWQLVRDGELGGISIGFSPISTPKMMPDTGGYRFDSVELVEFSVVIAPANVDCVVLRHWKPRQRFAPARR